MSEELIVETAQIKKAIAIINELNDERFPLLLQRIVDKLHSTTELAFKADEFEKLEKSFGLTSDKCHLIVDTLEFIYLQAAYGLMKKKHLQANLSRLNLSDEKASAIVGLWALKDKEIVDKIRQNKTISHNRLAEIKWRLSLNLATDLRTRQKNPLALFEFKLSNGVSTAAGDESVHVEFSKDQLFEFYEKLELIQKQIDSLNG